MNETMGVALVIGSTFTTALGSLYLKKGASLLSRKSLKISFQLQIGIFLFIISSAIFILALRFGRLSVLYPMTSFSYIWIFLLSKKALHEKINKFKIIGIVMIITGAFLVAG